MVFPGIWCGLYRLDAAKAFHGRFAPTPFWRVGRISHVLRLFKHLIEQLAPLNRDTLCGSGAAGYIDHSPLELAAA